jgi:hypothetical protein
VTGAQSARSARTSSVNGGIRLGWPRRPPSHRVRRRATRRAAGRELFRPHPGVDLEHAPPGGRSRSEDLRTHPDLRRSARSDGVTAWCRNPRCHRLAPWYRENCALVTVHPAPRPTGITTLNSAAARLRQLVRVVSRPDRIVGPWCEQEHRRDDGEHGERREDPMPTIRSLFSTAPCPVITTQPSSRSPRRPLPDGGTTAFSWGMGMETGRRKGPAYHGPVGECRRLRRRRNGGQSDDGELNDPASAGSRA